MSEVTRYAEKRGPDVFTVTAGVVGPQAAEQVLVALADAGYVVRADGVPAPDTAAAEVEWEQVTYLLAPAYRVVEEDDGWRVFKRVTEAVPDGN